MKRNKSKNHHNLNIHTKVKTQFRHYNTQTPARTILFKTETLWKQEKCPLMNFIYEVVLMLQPSTLDANLRSTIFLNDYRN